jgi:hypothetical protein
MEVTLSGMVTEVREVQELNAPDWMLMILLGMLIVAREAHWENAELPMVVTPSGIVTEVREVQWANAYSPMDVTLLGMVNAPAFPPGHWIKLVTALSYSTPSMLA